MNSEEARKITADLILGKKPPTLATVAVATVYASSGVNTDEAKAVARKLGDIGGGMHHLPLQVGKRDDVVVDEA